MPARAKHGLLPLAFADVAGETGWGSATSSFIPEWEMLKKETQVGSGGPLPAGDGQRRSVIFAGRFYIQSTQLLARITSSLAQSPNPRSMMTFCRAVCSRLWGLWAYFPVLEQHRIVPWTIRTSPDLGGFVEARQPLAGLTGGKDLVCLQNRSPQERTRLHSNLFLYSGPPFPEFLQRHREYPLWGGGALLTLSVCQDWE